MSIGGMVTHQILRITVTCNTLAAWWFRLILYFPASKRDDAKTPFDSRISWGWSEATTEG